MTRLRLTAASGDYDRTGMLSRGKISPEGINLQVIHLPPIELFYRMCNFLEFHVSEMSMGAYCHLLGRGESPFIGMPAFPSRAFRHSMVYYHIGSGIKRPEDLNGKRIAILEWGMTASIWMIGILMDEYGLDPTSIDWVAAKRPRVAIEFPPGIQIRYVNPGRDLSQMLESGDVDAALLHQVPVSFASESTRVKRLFQDYKGAEIDYYRRTGIHPIMHCVVVRRDVYKENPWVLRSVYKALVEARQRTVEALSDEGAFAAMIPLLPSVMEEMRKIFGTDFWPYGLKANHATLEKLLLYAHRQGISSRLLSVGELFGESVRDF
jgi:4,5-dihydroxyphthalate decarboxylase